MCTTFLDSIFRANDLGGFGIFATILAVLPASTLFCEDYNSGYCKAILCRVERKRYLQETLLCSGISGGLAVFLPGSAQRYSFGIINGEPTPGSRMGSTILQSLWELYMGNYSLIWTVFSGAVPTFAGLSVRRILVRDWVMRLCTYSESLHYSGRSLCTVLRCTPDSLPIG